MEVELATKSKQCMVKMHLYYKLYKKNVPEKDNFSQLLIETKSTTPQPTVIVVKLYKIMFLRICQGNMVRCSMIISAWRQEKSRVLGGFAVVRVLLVPVANALKTILANKADRKSVVQGKSVDLGGRRIIKKKKKIKK